MRKLFVVTIFILLVILVSPTASQTPLKDNYLNTYAQYLSSHQEYLTTQKAYIEFGTLKSKSDAQTATKTMLILRTETLLAYLLLLEEMIGPATDDNSLQLAVLQRDIYFYRQNLILIKEAISLEDLLKFSKEFENNYQNTTVSLIPMLRILGNYNTLDQYLNQLDSLYTQIDQTIPTLPGNYPKDKLSRDTQEALAQITQARETILQAKTHTLSSNVDDYAKLSLEAQSQLSQAQEKLTTASKFLLEISRQLPLP